MAKKKISRRSTKNIEILVLTCFFLSGLTGLIYEILWTRMIVKIIGSAPFAVSMILTIFMGGLGLGSYLASRTIDRIKEPIRLVRIYGILELAIGAYGLVIPVLLMAFKPLFAILYNQLFSHSMLYNLLTFVGCSILLCTPVICMGATLPILCRFYVTRLSHLGTHTGRLYGLNTIGAALGALLCGFWLINFLGVGGSLIVAVLVNGIIGLSCLLVSYKAVTQKVAVKQAACDSQKSLQTVRAEGTAPAEYQWAVNGALVIFAVSGFCAMAYEVIWTKLLGLIIGPTTYSFTIVLVTFILGLALGSMIFGWLADKSSKTIWLLIFTQIAAAFFVLGTSQLLGNSQLFFAKVIFNFKDQFTVLSVLKAVILFIFMILPTLCLGATFPLVGKICTQSVSKVGRSLGFAYAINSIGAVLGSFCAGFLLIPLLGKEKSLSVVIALQLLVSLIFAAIVLSKNKQSILKWASVAAPALVGLFLCLYFPMWNRYLLSEGRYYRFDQIETELEHRGWLETLLQGPRILTRLTYGKLVYYGDGIGGFTTVQEYADPLGDVEYIMQNSGKTDASSRGDMTTQTLSAHLPMLLHRNPKTIMVLGLASGITAGETLHYGIDQLDVIEINRQVVAASNFFLPWNNNVLSDPRTNLIIQDGRAHLQLTKQKYDVIISEPSNPWMAGLAALFTRDFFAIAKNRLDEDGIFVQWLHSYEMDWSAFALVGRTFAEVFPNSLLVMTSPSGRGQDYLLVGLKGSQQLALDRAKQKLSCIQQSRNVTLRDPRVLYRLIVSEDLHRLFGQGPVNTDNRPRLEFAAPKLIRGSDPMIEEEIADKKWLSPETRKTVQQVTTNLDAQIDFAAYAVSLYEPFRDMVDLSKATPSQKERFFKLMETYATKILMDYSIFRDDRLRQRCSSIQIETIEKNIELMPDKALSYSYLGNLYYAEDMLDEAITNYSKSLQIEPDSAFARGNLGHALVRQGNFEGAIKHYKEMLRIKPYLADARNDLGRARAHQGNLEEAIKHYTEALRIRPDFAEAHSYLGCALAQQGKLDEAITHFGEALRIRPDFAEAHSDLASALAQRGNPEQAIKHYTEALRIEPDFVMAHNNFGILLGTQGRLDGAIEHYTEALRIEPGFASAHYNLARTLVEVDKIPAAITHFKEALRIRPNWVSPMNNLAWLLATYEDPRFRDGTEAVQLAEQACKHTNYEEPELLSTLAAAYAAADRFPKAVVAAEDGLELAQSSGREELTEEIQNCLRLYKAGRPYSVSFPKLSSN